MNLKDRMQAQMKALTVSQAELGKAVGMSQVGVGKVLSGETLDPRKIVEIANYLKVSASWLKTGKGEKNSNSSPYEPLLAAQSDTPIELVTKESIQGLLNPMRVIEEGLTVRGFLNYEPEDQVKILRIIVTMLKKSDDIGHIAEVIRQM